MDKICVINPDIKEKFDIFLKDGGVMMFEAPCGFGKTTVVKELLKSTSLRVCEVRADEVDFEHITNHEEWDILFVDDLHLINDHEGYKEVSDLIKNNVEKRFIICGRGAVSGIFIPFKLSNSVIEIDENDLSFDLTLAAKLFSEYGLKLSETELCDIMSLTRGYPMFLDMYAQRMSRGAVYNKNLTNEIKLEIFQYYEEMIFLRFDLRTRRFLLELAQFELFNIELATMISGNSEVGRIMASLKRKTRMLRNDNEGMFSFWWLFREFLIWEQKEYYTPDMLSALYNRAALYYNLQKDYVKALEYYSKGGDTGKVSELITRLVSLHPGMGYYEKLEKYFVEISDEEIMRSPALMQGKSMLCGLLGDYEASEKWYGYLKEFIETRKPSDISINEAKSRLAWLDISLPQRKPTDMVETVKKMYDMINDKKISFAPFSVTSALPSVLNGGKDFSDWCRDGEKLLKKVAPVLEKIMGKDSIGITSCTSAEFRYEQGESISDEILFLVSKLNEIQTQGTPDTEFAIVGLLARCQMNIGKAEDARHTLNSLKTRFKANGHTRFIPNIDAMLCRIALKCGDIDYVAGWYRDKAPRNSLKFTATMRYRYITEAMAEIALDNTNAALLTLSPLEPYCKACSRHIDMIYLKVLTAIAKYRKGDMGWKSDMKVGLDIAEEYGYVRSVSEFGVAVLPILCETEKERKSEFLERTIKAARGQAVYYPDFMKMRNGIYERLTDTELDVLRLICKNKTNSDIGEILDIRLATVKSHVSHIFQKLDVSKRSEAKATAEKLHLI